MALVGKWLSRNENLCVKFERVAAKFFCVEILGHCCGQWKQCFRVKYSFSTGLPVVLVRGGSSTLLWSCNLWFRYPTCICRWGDLGNAFIALIDQLRTVGFLSVPLGCFMIRKGRSFMCKWWWILSMSGYLIGWIFHFPGLHIYKPLCLGILWRLISFFSRSTGLKPFGSFFFLVSLLCYHVPTCTWNSLVSRKILVLPFLFPYMKFLLCELSTKCETRFPFPKLWFIDDYLHVSYLLLASMVTWY